MKKHTIIILFFTHFIFSQNALGDSEFLPEAGKYIVSGWVKEVHSGQVLTYSSFLRVSITGVTLPLTKDLVSRGAIIEGWQRIMGVIEIPSLVNATNPVLDISLQCNNTSGNECYFDDIRFYPFNGNMKSFVYDEDTQRLMSELDENNYATFYEYDLEGGLVRVKKETERGVFTIQETRSNNPKKE
jgi:hypothetical protein